jgi:hypothetical protein
MASLAETSFSGPRLHAPVLWALSWRDEIQRAGRLTPGERERSENRVFVGRYVKSTFPEAPQDDSPADEATDSERRKVEINPAFVVMFIRHRSGICAAQHGKLT